MAFERFADKLIREAIADGRLDVVADGRRLDLDDYFAVPESLRMAYSVLKSAGCVPEEVELLKDVDRLRTALGAAPNEQERGRIQASLTAAELRLSLALERARQR